MAKKSAFNGLAGQLETFKNAQIVIAPPASLTSDAEKRFFGEITRSRASDTWNEADITTAALLATTLAQLEAANAHISEHGLTSKSDRGTPVVSPYLTAKSQLAGQVLALQRALGLSASQRGVSGEEQGKRNQNERKMRNTIDGLAGNPLLAGMSDRDELLA